MKKYLLLVVLCAALVFGGSGCESLTPEQIQQLATQQEVLQKQADEIQAAATELTEKLAAGGIIDPNMVAKIAKLNEEADRIQTQINTIAMALANVKLSGDTNQDWLAMAQAAAGAATPMLGPYAVPVNVGIAVLGYILAWLAKRKKDEAALALTEVVKGGEQFKAGASDEAVTAFKTAQGSAQSATTKEMVAVIKAT